MSSASAFEEHFAREIMHSERTRMAVLAGVLAALLAVFALFSALYQEDYHRLGLRGVFVKAGAAPREPEPGGQGDHRRPVGVSDLRPSRRLEKTAG